MRELLNKVNVIKEYELKNCQKSDLNLDKIYSNLLMQRLTESLPSLEMKFVGLLSNRREEGLKLLKKGSVSEGSEDLMKLRNLIQNTKISKEAFLFLDTFQSAAEAYLYYKTGQFSNAIKVLLQSIESQRILRVEFNHNCEIRKVHLTVNIIRIMIANQNFDEALLHSCNLLKYIWLNHEMWPFESCFWGEKEILSIEEKMSLSDQIFNEIGVLIRKKLITNIIIISSLKNLKNDLNYIDGTDKVNLWLETQIAFNSHNFTFFINTSTSFFKNGPEYLYYSWKHLENQLLGLDSQF